MKKLSLLLLAFIVLNLLLAGAVFGSNAQEKISMRFYIGENNYYINNQPFLMDTVPLIREGRTMLPIRFVADPMGAEVTWDSSARKTTIKLKDTEIELWIGENTARVNGENIMIDPDNPEVKPLIVQPGRTFLPLRFISENLGIKVDWHHDRGEVTLLYPAPLEPQKKTTLVIEGMEEEITLHLRESSLYPYAIYLDEDRYRMEIKEDKDVILPRAEVSPEVFMAIWHRENTDISALAPEIEDELKEKYANVHVEGLVEKPLAAYHLYAVGGAAWDDTVERYYLVQDFEGGVIIIQQKLFNEAVEGHGVRFNGMLEELYIRPGEEKDDDISDFSFLIGDDKISIRRSACQAALLL